jgi:tripartite-type tricarboxylate transporter receptor subunit TctC
MRDSNVSKGKATMKLMRRKRTSLITAMAALATGMLWAPTVPAQGSAARTVRFVVPTSPGSNADTQARSVGEGLQALTGQTVVTENRVGAGGSIAASTLSAARPDGQTVGFQGKAYLLFGVEFPAQNFDPMRDVSPVAFISRGAFVLVVGASSAHTSLKGLIDYARTNPGKLDYASAGQGSTSYISAERLRAAAKVSMLHVPFKGSPEAVREVIAGGVHFTYIPAAMSKSLIESGRVRALAVNTARRSILLPEVPTVIEAGLPHSNYESWLVALVPANTPGDIQEQLNQQFNAAIKTPAMAERFAKLGVEPEPMNLIALRAFVKGEYAAALELDRQLRAKSP